MMNENSRFGILGGGLAGLTSAYYLSKRLPESSQIIVWEKADRFGGWVQSSRVDDQTNGGSFVFESGPRSVRPKGLAGLISLELVGLNLFYRQRKNRKLNWIFFFFFFLSHYGHFFV
jgi:oxygen-dependent protoporphyrinogen oxidase